jgi:hypothetical protein
VRLVEECSREQCDTRVQTNVATVGRLSWLFLSTQFVGGGRILPASPAAGGWGFQILYTRVMV